MIVQNQAEHERYMRRSSPGAIGACLGALVAFFAYPIGWFSYLGTLHAADRNQMVKILAIAQRHGDLKPYFSEKIIHEMAEVERERGPILEVLSVTASGDLVNASRFVNVQLKRRKGLETDNWAYGGDKAYHYSAQDQNGRIVSPLE